MYSPSHGQDGVPVTNTQSTLCTAPHLYKNVTLAVLYGNNRNSYTISTHIHIYSGPSKIKRFDSRTNWNSNKKFEKNSVWNSNKNSKVEPWARRCTASCGSCHLTRKSNKLKVEPPLGTDCVRLSRVHCIYVYIYIFYIHTHTHTHTHTYTNTHIHTYTYTHTHIHTYTYTHAHTHTHTHAYILHHRETLLGQKK
jgi:hypothetical protein